CRKTYGGEETGVNFDIYLRSRNPWSTIFSTSWGEWNVLPGQLLIDGGEYNWSDFWFLENRVLFYPPEARRPKTPGAWSFPWGTLITRPNSGPRVKETSLSAGPSPLVLSTGSCGRGHNGRPCHNVNVTGGRPGSSGPSRRASSPRSCVSLLATQDTSPAGTW